MAQEVRVGGNEVLLSLSPEYRPTDINNSAEAVQNLLGAVQRFKPFNDYLTGFKAPAECELTTVLVRNIGQVGSRVASVTLEVTLRHAKSAESTTLTQPVYLSSDQVPAVVLPILAVQGDESNAGGSFAVLFPRARLALGAQTVLDAPFGYFENASGEGDASASAASSGGAGGSKPLRTVNGISQSDLEAAGFTAQHMTEKMCTVATGDDVVCGYEGQVPIRVLTSKRPITSAELEKMMEHQQQSGSSSSFVLVALEDVPSRTTDIHAILAASLSM